MENMQNIETPEIDQTLLNAIYSRVSRFYPGLSEKTIKKLIEEYMIEFYKEKMEFPTTTDAFLELSKRRGNGKNHMSEFSSKAHKEGAHMPTNRRPRTRIKERANRLRGLILSNKES